MDCIAHRGCKGSDTTEQLSLSLSLYSLKGLMLKLEYFGHLIRRANSLEKTLILGQVEGKRRRGRHRMGWLDSIPNSNGMNLSKLGNSEEWKAWLAAVHGVAKSQIQLSD